MHYELNVTDKKGNFLDVVKGDDVHDVLMQAAKLRTKKFLGYYYEKQKIIHDTCIEYAEKLTGGFAKNISVESISSIISSIEQSEITWDFILNEFYDKNPKPDKDNQLFEEPVYERIPPEPKKENSYYQYKFNVKDELIPFRKGKSISRLNAEFKRDHLLWQKKKESIEARNRDKERGYNDRLKYSEENYLNQLEKWVNKKSEITDRMRTFKEGYQNKKAFAIEKFCELILNQTFKSTISEHFKATLKYVEASKFLFLEISLPPKSEFNFIKEISFSKLDDKFVEVYYTEEKFTEKYKTILHQYVLTSLFAIFLRDKINAIDEIGFRGVVPLTDMDKKIFAPVISLSIKKDDVKNINFNQISFGECFAILNGVYSEDYIEQFNKANVTKEEKLD